jgi:hypothetical protein
MATTPSQHPAQNKVVFIAEDDIHPMSTNEQPVEKKSNVEEIDGSNFDDITGATFNDDPGSNFQDTTGSNFKEVYSGPNEVSTEDNDNGFVNLGGGSSKKNEGDSDSDSDSSDSSDSSICSEDIMKIDPIMCRLNKFLLTQYDGASVNIIQVLCKILKQLEKLNEHFDKK